MKNIEKFMLLNVTFNDIDEMRASKIMQEEYSFSKLNKYTVFFEKYQKGENRGKFICLDFSQLYYLAEIDMHFSQILMAMYLVLENRMKCLFLHHAEHFCDTHLLLVEYYESDREFIDSTYKTENFDILQDIDISSGIQNLSLADFMDIIQFGTFERLIHFFYKKYALEIYHSISAPFERNLESVRKIRNIVAHNNSLMDKISNITKNKNVHVSAFLGQNGIRHRMLKTNMEKEIINDLCTFFETYSMFVPNSEDILMTLKNYEDKYILPMMNKFEKNDKFMSMYVFMRIAIEKILKNY